jgi:hypothetical protein
MMIAAKKKQLEIHNKLLFPQINKENSTSIPPQPKVKIADLSHNLIGCYDTDSRDHLLRKQPTVKSHNTRKNDGSPILQSMSPHQQYLLQQMYSQNGHPGSVGTASMAQPKTPNDIYGFAQKAILHSIFDKQLLGGNGQAISNGHGHLGTQGGYIKTRHTTPFISNLGSYKGVTNKPYANKSIFRKHGQAAGFHLENIAEVVSP